MEDKIQIIDLIGEGGFAQVYLVVSKEFQNLLAVKTYKNDFLSSPEIQSLFKKEAKIWMDIGAHPNIVRLFYVDSKARRLYIGMEYIPCFKDKPNSLDRYLNLNQIDIIQSIRWGIQFCHGMEYAYSMGLKAHRDIKPSNIMLDGNKTVKISDFGLALGLNAIIADNNSNDIKNKRYTRLGITQTGDWFGTPEYMSPEQFTNFSHCDVRSDIYSFGIVIFQMCNKGNLPFFQNYKTENWTEKMHDLHLTAPIPEFESPLQYIVKKCLEKNPDDRYQSFMELREELEKVLFEIAGEKIPIPNPSRYTIGDLINRGNSYVRMGFFKEAEKWYDFVLDIESNQIDAINGKGRCLLEQGFDMEAISLLNTAITISPNASLCWLNRGNCYFKQGHYSLALSDYQECIKLDGVDSTDSFVWSNIGTCLLHIGKIPDSLLYFDKALEMESDLAETLGNKGVALLQLDRYDESLSCFDRALKLDPLFTIVWHNKGLCHVAKGNFEKAIQCFDTAIEIDGNHWPSLQSKGHTLLELGRSDEAKRCFDKYEEIVGRKEI